MGSSWSLAQFSRAVNYSNELAKILHFSFSREIPNGPACDSENFSWPQCECSVISRGFRIVEWSPLQSVFSTGKQFSLIFADKSCDWKLRRAGGEIGPREDTSILHFSLIHRLQSVNCIAFGAVYFYLRHWPPVQLTQLHPISLGKFKETLS